MEYKIETINDLCLKITDGSHFSPEHEEFGEYQMYSVKDMEYNGFSDKDCKMIGKEMFEKLSKSDCRPLKNDILIAKDGSYLKCAFKVKEDLNACILSSIAILRPNLKNIDPDYFVYLMRSKSIKGAMANYVSGSALPRIILSDFKKMKLKMISDISIQSKIARILSKYDDLLENNNKRIKLLQKMAQNIYKEWFVRLRFPGYEKCEFVNGIPKRWEYKKIGECGEVVGGGTPSTDNDEYWDGDIPWLTPADLSTFNYIYIKNGDRNITSLGLKKSSAKLMPKNTILLSSRAPIGYVAIAQNEIATNQGFKNVICNESILNYAYLFYFFKLNTVALQNFATGATFPELSSSMLKRIKILLPAIELQNKFCEIITPLFKEINILVEKNSNLEKQRDLLLPRLMSGKLEVK